MTELKTDRTPRWRVMERLFWLRNILVVVQLGVLLLVLYGLKISLFAGPMLFIISALWVWNLAVRWRLGLSAPVTDTEITFNLTIDMLALAGLLYWSGGSTNPFVSLFLVPVVLAAAFLRIRDIIWMVILGAVLYTLLLRQYVPLPPVGTRFGGDFNLHILGMWASFLISAMIAAVFVYNLARTGRQREQELAEVREKLIRNEHIVAVGAMAAGAVHEMNTPLSTIAMLAEELNEEAENSELVQQDAIEIATQVERCRVQLQGLRQTAQTARGEQAQRIFLEEYLRNTINHWSALRPDIELSVKIKTEQIKISDNQNLSMALTNLLDNAADASLDNEESRVIVFVGLDKNSLLIYIDDFGKGLSASQLKQAGKQSFSTKQKGIGIGLVLSHATLEQLKGRLELSQRDKIGTRAQITIPLGELQ